MNVETWARPHERSCAACGARHEPQTWQELPLVTTLEPTQIQAHLSIPAPWSVELRRCPCGNVLAALRDVARAS